MHFCAAALNKTRIASHSSSVRLRCCRTCKYVITLDTDTQLPRDSARQFVGAMAHPLNRARYDEDKQRVCEGYGILQPRVAVSLPGTNRSRYARLYGSEPGIDPYTRAVSDVYQDLFGEGSFIGKGIYEVDAFERVAQGSLSREPDSQPRSSGRMLRAGGAVERCAVVRGDIPLRYSADVSRRHRWIRGDWQIARWLLPRVPGPGARRQKNPLSGLSRWKIFDNLRRSLVPSGVDPSVAARLDGLVTVLVVDPVGDRNHPDSSVAWLYSGSVSEAGGCAAGAAFRRRRNARPADTSFRRLFTLACLPYEAFFSLDAIVRTIWRMLVTRTRLLEWSPSSESGPQSPHRPRRLLSVDVDRAGYCHCRGDLSDAVGAGRV